MQKVLVILKSDDLGLALRDALKHYFEVITCDNAVTGSEMLQHQPDALVLDLFLPETDGISFLKNNPNSHPRVIVMLTSYISSDIVQAMSDSGVDYAIRKPCPISTITSHLLNSLKNTPPG